jgi:curved DNA-binding protein CbpA
MNYYEYLGISMNASFEEIDKAYKKLALKFHPDTNSGDRYFEEQFKQLNEAHSVLSHAEKRQKYDIGLLNETNKHFKIEELKRKAAEKELELQKQIEIRKRQKEAYERQLQSQQQEKFQQKSYEVTTSNYRQEQRPKTDKRKFWRRAVNIMLIITIGLGIVIFSTKKGEWKSKPNVTQKKESETNKTTTQKETKGKAKIKVDNKTVEKVLTDSTNIDEKDSKKELEKHSDSSFIKSN